MEQKLSEIVKRILVSPTEELILKRCGTAEEKEESEEKSQKSLDEIKLIYLPHFHIRNLGQISSCRFLTICILHNNFLSSFHQLSNCPLLIKLDLHCNQLSTVPDARFWKNMKSLQVLNLHDNGLHEYDSILAISNCQSLIALTLHDTPLSLKQHYRHQVVNSIWTLKALDHHVISDCEVIEDITPLPHFKPLNPRLQINLCPKLDPSNQKSNNVERVEMEIKSVEGLMKEINRILAHSSPVLIIQRWHRGHMVRKKMNNNNRKVVSKPRDVANDGVLSKQDDNYFRYINQFIGFNPSAGVAKPQAKDKKIETIKVCLPRLQGNAPKATPRKTIVENLPNLRKELLQDQKQNSNLRIATEILLQQIIKDEKPKKVKSLPTARKNNKETTTTGANETTQQHETLMLRSTQPPINMKQPMSEMIISKKESGCDVRAAIEELHSAKLRASAPAPAVVKQHRSCGRRPMSGCGGMSMAMLMAVTKAYGDREKEDRQLHRVQKVLKIQGERKQEEQIVTSFHNEKREQISKQRMKDDVEMQESLEKQAKERNNYLQLARFRKEASLARHRQKHNDLLFVTDFINQHTSVSKALIKHDQHMKRQEQQTQRNKMVENIRRERDEKRALFRHYMEHKRYGEHLKLVHDQHDMERYISRNQTLRMLNKKRVVDCIRENHQMQAMKKMENSRLHPTKCLH